MRADRLLSLLMLLQTRGMQSASSLAQALEVTERTIYRDVIALSTAGVPVYTAHGPGGGIALVEDYRTNLTGLNPDEVRALFSLAIPAPLEQLGVGSEIRSALLKLSASLTTLQLEEKKQANQKIYLDSTDWSRTEYNTLYLKIIQSALWNNQELNLVYLSSFEAKINYTIAPLGLVAKGNTWYLVGQRDNQIRVLSVAQVLQAELSGKFITPPADFDLPGFWKNWCAEQAENRQQFTAMVRVSPLVNDILTGKSPGILAVFPAHTPDQWQTLELTFDSFEAARTRVLSLGSGIEVIQPLSLRRSVEDYALQTLSIYRNISVDIV